MKEIKLFDYQEDMKERIEKALRLHRSVMAQMPTGTGKTVLLASVVESFLREHSNCHVWIVAHRRELVSQIKDTLNKFLLNFSFSNHPVPLSKEGSTFSPSPSSSGSGDVTALRCSEPLRSKDGGPSKVSPDCAGWDRQDGSGDTTSACSLDAGSSFSACSSVALDVVQRELKHLGLWKFAGAVMFVMKMVFGLSEDRMIAPMDEKEGRFLLDEIMRGGNFGQYDDRMGSKVDESKIHRYFRMNLRNLRFVKHYPTEAGCEPVFRTWFAGWKFINRIK